MSLADLYGALEAGGTKFVCTVGSGPDDVRDVVRFPTEGPDETIPRTIRTFEAMRDEHGELAAVGIGSFGPVDLDPDSDTFGFVTKTPKPGWSNTDLRGPIAEALGVPVAFDTDVNAAAFGEWTWGAAQGLDTFCYLTVGTGIGGGGMARGELLHGLVHPEMGHQKFPRDTERDPYPGRCPFHADCWEGLAAGPAIEERWGKKAQDLPADHEAWELEADLLAAGLHNLVCLLSPERIILGGGVMHQTQLFPMIRAKLLESLAGYVQAEALLESPDTYVVPPALGDRAGILGCMALAQREIGS